MEAMFERVAGIDIGKATLTLCVRTRGDRARRHTQTRTFKTTTGSLLVIRDWLLECGVTIAAFESTSTYWKRRGLLPGGPRAGVVAPCRPHAWRARPEEVKDAEWIAQLLERGLSPSWRR